MAISRPRPDQRIVPPTDATPDLALDLSGVTKGFGEQTVVRDLALQVRPGELMALLGPSGCGKTTTLRLIAGFEEPDAGVIRIGGRTVAESAPGVRRIDPPERRRVGMVFQDYALFPHLSVAKNVAFGLPRGERGRDERVSAALTTVGLAPLAARMPDQLSGGQQQRVALARALAPHPDL
ncbi:MAG: ABC transporter ATP-binding protein, partial [Thermomicrobiales bacterium]